MISYEEAKNIVIEAGRVRGSKTEIQAVQKVVGRVCAKAIQAPIDIQPFDNSAMDGFAVRLCDLGEDGGVLKKAGIIAAGDAVPEISIQSGTCVEIMTGAPTPPGAEAVVPVELVEVHGDDVRFKVRPKMSANIRRAGEDFQKGMAVLSAGQLIHPQHIMPLAALGIDTIEVFKRPRAVLLATGDELIEDLSQDLQPGQIYNSNRPYGMAALEAMGIECVLAPSISDDPDLFEALLKDWALQDVDFIISSGAVSAGRFDFVRKGLQQAGADILFHKVKMKPGKPNLFARLPNGTLYFGLPGNPVAMTTGLRFLVQPCMRSMMGLGEEKAISAKVITAFKKHKGLRIFLKSCAEFSEDGVLMVCLLDGQESFKVSPFLSMNCWVAALEGIEQLNVGDIVDVYPLYPHSGIL